MFVPELYSKSQVPLIISPACKGVAGFFFEGGVYPISSWYPLPLTQSSPSLPTHSLLEHGTMGTTLAAACDLVHDQWGASCDSLGIYN